MTLNSLISYNSGTSIGTWNSTNYNLCRVSDVVSNVSQSFTNSNQTMSPGYTIALDTSTSVGTWSNTGINNNLCRVVDVITKCPVYGVPAI